MKSYSQPWLDSRSTDIIFILLPAVLPLLIIILLPEYFSVHTEVTTIWWIVLVLAIDVAHVYSTLFRFYWNPKTYQKFKSHIFLIPLIGLVSGVILYTLGAIIFWRVLAYLAVFHFIRQQYGFMRLYSRYENKTNGSKLIDGAAIYCATLYPLLYWHMYLTNEINWFIKDDFILLPQVLAPYAKGLYVVIGVVYFAKEVTIFVKDRYINLPKNAIVVGTYISWYAGIVYFKGDLIFTMMNVVAHGIPYMALVYIHDKNTTSHPVSRPWKKITFFLVTIIFLAVFEETVWDILVWKGHQNIFPLFTSMAQINDHAVLSLVIPLLTLPQFTHYVLDGFIWKKPKIKS